MSDTTLTLTPNPAQQKAALRQKIKELQTAEPQDYAAMGVMMAVRVITRPEWITARKIFLFLGAAHEPDTLPLVRAAFAGGKLVYVPRILENGQMEAVGITNLTDLVPGPYGILTAGENAPVCKPEDLQLAVMPCLAASPTGQRLGHGAGYYDRWLTRFRGTKMVLCPDHLLFAHIPTEPTDVDADLVISENDTYLATK